MIAQCVLWVGGGYSSRGKVELVYVSRATRDRGIEMEEFGRWEDAV
jgi:hypothetical protein